jgi:dTDP-4-amino-4,6-dideoxyglucose
MASNRLTGRSDVGFFGGTPIFETPLQIVRPRFPAFDAVARAFQAALESGQVTNNGPSVQAFERQLTEYLGIPTLVFCNGQTALMAMLRAAGIEAGEVVVPSFTFSATPHAVRWCGAWPLFADVHPESMCLDPVDVERRITPKTVAILGVDAYGIACDYRALEEIARRHRIRLLLDSAPSFGTRVNGQLVGGFGDAQMFSFHATKAFATMEGGCICSHDRIILDRAKAIRNFGQVSATDCEEPGLNGKMLEICALIGLEQLKTFEQAAQVRRRSVRRMQDGLAAIRGISVGKAPPNQEPIWLYLPVIIDEHEFGLDRDGAALALEKENLHVRKYYSPPCHHLSAYRDQRSEPLPQTEALAYNVIALPVYNDMTDDECDGIVKAFADVHQHAARIAQALKNRSVLT